MSLAISHGFSPLFLGVPFATTYLKDIRGIRNIFRKRIELYDMNKNPMYLCGEIEM